MPRIRTVKPEIHSHRKTGPLSDRDFRVFLGLITQADDEGRLVAEPAQLRAVLFAYHPRVRLADVADALGRLAALALIQLYAVAGVRYAWLRSWADHQRIHKHHWTPSKLPAPPPVYTNPGDVPDQYGTDTAGREGNGTEGIGTPQTPQGGIEWLDTLNREAGTHFKPTDSNLRAIRARLREGHTLADAEAVVRTKVAEWRGTDFAKYLRPSTLFGPKFDSYLQASRNGHPPDDEDSEE